jgi:predicted dehydrogenase
MGLTYAECLTRHSTGARLIAVSGGTRAPDLASRYGVAYAPTLDNLLDRGDVDVVALRTR